MGTSTRRWGLAVVALAAAVLVPGASAARASTSVELALVPLPKAALGAVGRALPIAHDSGVVSNAEAANEATAEVTAKQLKSLGRVTGYLLDYGNPFGGRAGIRQIQTEIDRYRSVADAHAGLAFWRKDELKAPTLRKFGIDFTLQKMGLSGIATPHWAYAGTASVNGLTPIRGVDAQFQQGRYLLDVSVSAASISAAKSLAPKVARKLYRRMRLVLAGSLHASSVKLPGALKPGPPPHGPKPASLVLRKADLSGSVTVAKAGYARPKNSLDPNALSAYNLTMTPAGSFPYLSQELVVGSTTLEVKYFAAIALGAIGAGLRNNVQTTPVNLAGVGDNAHGEILRVQLSGHTAYEAVVVLSHGSYLSFVLVASTSTVAASDVRNLARKAAHRLDAGFGA
jgi:hypothetical protein